MVQSNNDTNINIVSDYQSKNLIDKRPSEHIKLLSMYINMKIHQLSLIFNFC